jgi:hypothetical protein
MGALVWDERLISRAGAYALAGDWPVTIGRRKGLLFLDCGRCGLGVLTLGAAGNPFTISPDGVISAVLRHAVSGHGINLGRNRDGHGDERGRAAAGPGQRPPADRGRGRRRDPGDDPGHHRQPDQETDPGGKRVPAGGDR